MRSVQFPLAAVLAATTVGSANAQVAYPEKPVRLIVPSSPSGGTDTTARILSPRISELLGQQLVIENRPGAATRIGAGHVAKSAPDGYTLLITPSTLIIAPSVYKDMAFDPLKDFEPITQVVVVPQMLVSHPSLPPKNVQELIAFAKARPGKLEYASSAVGSNPQMAMVLFLNLTGTSIVHVPYKSGNAGLSDVIAGHVPLTMANILAGLPHVRNGRLRAYGVTTAKRAVGAPDIPTIAEAGVPGYESVQWFGILAPINTPREIVTRLHRDITRVTREKEIQQRFLVDGAEAHWSETPEQFGEFMRAESAKWAKVVAQAKIPKR
ncbi:MAG: tripartite tricarboxylate transporter substrate binding protein [Betaproteobacteria bacterium]|nr:tripartite tricarboxylate transporter substrate binding protein [Betaproteobacteria bacterium]